MNNKLKLSFFGLATGFCNGLFGSGGGMIVVPCLEKFQGLEARKAHATAIAVILPISIVSIFKYVTFSKLPYTVLLTVCAGGVLGSFIGAKLLKRFTGKTIRRIFGCFIIAAAVRMVIA